MDIQHFLQQNPNILMFAQFGLIGLVFYFLLFFPMQKQKKKQQEMLANLKTGDIVVTSGGIQGTVTAVDSDTIILRIKPDQLKLQFARAAVTALVQPDGPK